MSLSEEHELQIQAYLRFAKLKRDQHVREFTTVQHDFLSGRIRAGVSDAGGFSTCVVCVSCC